MKSRFLFRDAFNFNFAVPFLLLATFLPMHSSRAERPAQDPKAILSTALLMADLGLLQDSITFESININKVDSRDTNNDLYQAELRHSRAGQIRFLIRGPKGFFESSPNQKRRPTLAIIAGFFTGQDTLHLLNSDQTNSESVTVAYEYPFKIDDIQKDPAKFLHLLRLTPGQIALMLSWIQQQRWSEDSRSAILGVSLGGLFLPSSVHIAQRLGAGQRKTIFICTGADLREIIKPNLNQQIGPFLSHTLSEALFHLTIPLSPELHAPYMESEFLFIRTRQDQVFTEQSSRMLFENLQPPKQEIIFEGLHIMPDQKDLILKIQNAVENWLTTN